jgi:hypothetical protein
MAVRFKKKEDGTWKLYKGGADQAAALVLAVFFLSKFCNLCPAYSFLGFIPWKSKSGP